MEQQFEEEAHKQIKQVLNKMQHVYHVDVGGFGTELRIKHPKVWKKCRRIGMKPSAKSRLRMKST